MSLTHANNSRIEQQPFSLWRCVRFPLIVLIVFGAIFSAPWICDALEVETEEFVPLMMMTSWLTPFLALLVLTLWWLFFANQFSRPTRWLTFLVLAVFVGGGLYFAFQTFVRKVELTTTPVGLIPRLHFTWQPSPQQRVEDYEKRETKDTELPLIDPTIGPEDFPSYRGTKQDGVVPWARLDTDWDKSPPKLLWKRPCGDGYSGIAVAGNIAVTLEQRQGMQKDDEQETLVCYDRATGNKRWVYAFDGQYKDPTHMGDGPRSTPTIHNQRIFGISASGVLVCLDAEGKKQWSVDLFKTTGAKNVKWGLTGSPLIVGDLVIAHAGVDPDAPVGPSLIAYDQATGNIAWKTGKRRAGYGSPQLVTLANTPQILLFDGEGLVSYDPKSGAELWNFPWDTDYDMNSIQPVVVGSDRVFISSELKNGCAMLRVTPPKNDDPMASQLKLTWNVETVWKHQKLAARFANPVTDGKYIFALHNMAGNLMCLDANDGSVQWKRERFGPGQILLANGVLVILSGDSGEVTLVEANGKVYKELARHRVLNDKSWNTPALAGDQLFVRNQSSIACLKLPQR